jgi:hypothetical protein
MAKLLAGGGDTFDALAYGRPHPGTMQFLEAQLNTATQHLTQAGQSFMATAHDLWERTNGSTAMRVMRAAARAARSLWDSDEIKALLEIGQLQHAPPTMQRWIMAEPTIRKLYHNQACDGYEGTYVDMHPKDIGEGHYDYRRVMDGVVVLDEDGGWHSDQWAEELLPDDTDLPLEDQVDILDTWAAIKSHVVHGKEDPTSKWNSTLR